MGPRFARGPMLSGAPGAIRITIGGGTMAFFRHIAPGTNADGNRVFWGMRGDVGVKPAANHWERPRAREARADAGIRRAHGWRGIIALIRPRTQRGDCRSTGDAMETWRRVPNSVTRGTSPCGRGAISVSRGISSAYARPYRTFPAHSTRVRPGTVPLATEIDVRAATGVPLRTEICRQRHRT